MKLAISHCPAFADFECRQYQCANATIRFIVRKITGPSPSIGSQRRACDLCDSPRIRHKLSMRTSENRTDRKPDSKSRVLVIKALAYGGGADWPQPEVLKSQPQVLKSQPQLLKSNRSCQNTEPETLNRDLKVRNPNPKF